MKTRIVYTKFWQDNYISSLSHKEKLLFIYLLTNEKVNLVGVYELPDKYILADLELTPKELQEIKQKFIKDNKFKFHQGYVKIINCEKYNNFTGEKNELAKKKELALISDSVLKELDTVSIGYAYPMHSLNNQKSIINNKKEGSMRGTKINFNEFVRELNDQAEFWGRGITATILENTYNKIKDYEKSKGKKYKDYKATIKNWLRKEIEGGKFRRTNKESASPVDYATKNMNAFMDDLVIKYKANPQSLTEGQISYLKKSNRI